ncbi:hypothetical protein F4703DRAFT_1014888 [Phycomyces blakesleeanus]
MLRTSSASAARSLQTACRPSLVSLRFQSTAAAEESKASTDDTKTDAPSKTARLPLSARLGGSGRGKPLENADPFSLFLANARPARTNTGREANRGRPNNNRGPRPQKQAAPGQFDDAVESKPKNGEARTASSTETQSRPPRQPRNNYNNNNSNNTTTTSSEGNNNESTNAPNNNRFRNRSFNDRKTGEANNGDRRFNNSNNNNRNNNRSNDRSKSFESRPRRSEVSSSPVRRVVTFIDKDIDWASLNPNESLSAQPVIEGEVDSSVTLGEAQGDYGRYVGIANELKWSDTVNVPALTTLVGGNATYSLPQKSAFLQIVSKATMGA